MTGGYHLAFEIGAIAVAAALALAVLLARAPRDTGAEDEAIADAEAPAEPPVLVNAG